MIPAERMKLVAVSGVHVRPVAGCLLHCWCLHQLICAHAVFGRGTCPLATLLVPHVRWSGEWSLTPKGFDDNQLFLEAH